MNPYWYPGDWTYLKRIHTPTHLSENTILKLKNFVSEMQLQQLQVLRESTGELQVETFLMLPTSMFLLASFDTLADLGRCIGLFEVIHFISEDKCKDISLNVQNFIVKDLNDLDETRILHLLAYFHDAFTITAFHIEFKNQFDMKGLSGMTPILTAILDENFDVANSLLTAQAEALVKQEVKKLSRFHRFLIDTLPRIVTLMEDDVKGRLSRDIVSRLQAEGQNSEQIGQVLAKLFYDLKNVVRYWSPDITKSFLQHCNIMRFSRLDLQEVVAASDWHHIEVLINHQPRTEHSLMFSFVDLIVNEISDYQRSERGRNFLKRAFTWEVLKEDSVEHFEQVLRYAHPDSIALFLKYGFHSIAKAECGRNILGALFRNEHVSAFSLLKNEKVDVDERYCEGNTALHIAAELGISRNVPWLLERGANPNAVNSRKDTPLSLILSSGLVYGLSSSVMSFVHSLLRSGADATMINNPLNAGIFGPEAKKFAYRDERVMTLLAVHFAIKEAFGFSIETAVKTFARLFALTWMQRLFEKSRREVKEMKTHVICETKKYQQNAFSILTLLAVSPEKIAHLVKEEELKVINEFLEMKGSSWPWYYSVNLKQHVKGIIKINQLRERATFYTCQFMDIQDPDHLVIIKIVRYLSIKDLLIFEE